MGDSGIKKTPDVEGFMFNDLVCVQCFDSDPAELIIQVLMNSKEEFKSRSKEVDNFLSALGFNVLDNKSEFIEQDFESGFYYKIYKFSGNHKVEQAINALQNYQSETKNTSIYQLDLRENDISATGLQTLINNNHTIEFLFLSSNKINDVNLDINDNSSIFMLLLDKNKVGDNILKSFAGHLININTIDLNNNLVGNNGLIFLSKLTSLDSLSIRNNHFDNNGLHHFIELLTDTSITELDVSENNIGDEGAMIFANNPVEISDLKLMSNNITDRGAIALAKSEQLGVITLDLSHNNISDESAIAFAKISYNNSWLNDLNLSYNKITNSGAFALANASFDLPITVLDVSYNKINTEGINALKNCNHYDILKTEGNI